MQTAGRKVYVDVLVLHSKDTGKIPREITYNDKSYKIDRLIARTRAPAQIAGGHGTRYTVQIKGKQAYLFEDGNAWFVEEKLGARHEQQI